jgi:DNA-binding FadR family transcriptional regulator
MLAETGSAAAHDELASVVEGIPKAREEGQLATATATMHRRLVELAANATLAIIAGMLYEITVRYTSSAIQHSQDVPEAQYIRLLKSYHRLVELVGERDGAAVESHWRRHMDAAHESLLRVQEHAKVRDVMR